MKRDHNAEVTELRRSEYEILKKQKIFVYKLSGIP